MNICLFLLDIYLRVKWILPPCHMAVFWYTPYQKKTWRFPLEIKRLFGLHPQAIWLD